MGKNKRQHVEIIEVAKLVSYNKITEPYDNYGDSIAVSEDGLLCLVGSSHSNGDKGKVHTYTRAKITDLWVKAGTLESSSKHFGRSLAMSGDGLHAIVVSHSGLSDSERKVYTYNRTSRDQLWSAGNVMVVVNLDCDNRYGKSITISGDGLTCMVGDGYDNSLATVAGVVYTYTRDTVTSVWVEVDKMTASDGLTGDLYGGSVTLSDDGLTCMVGASNSLDSEGEVYTYKRTSVTDTWTEVSMMVATDARGDSFYGHSVSMTGDGLHAIVGAYGHGVPGVSDGAVYLYKRDTVSSEWKEIKKFTHSGGGSVMHFGYSSTISNDGKVIMVGAEQNYLDKGTIGIVYTYTTNL